MMIRSSTAATATITNNLASENCVFGAKTHGSVFKIANGREKIGPLASIFRDRSEKPLAYGLRVRFWHYRTSPTIVKQPRNMNDY